MVHKHEHPHVTLYTHSILQGWWLAEGKTGGTGKPAQVYLKRRFSMLYRLQIHLTQFY
jgi:hypothetical protein